jgi:hypothetical protein
MILADQQRIVAITLPEYYNPCNYKLIKKDCEPWRTAQKQSEGKELKWKGRVIFYAQIVLTSYHKNYSIPPFHNSQTSVFQALLEYSSKNFSTGNFVK